jgi:hypothetical protein
MDLVGRKANTQESRAGGREKSIDRRDSKNSARVKVKDLSMRYKQEKPRVVTQNMYERAGGKKKSLRKSTKTSYISRLEVGCRSWKVGGASRFAVWDR